MKSPQKAVILTIGLLICLAMLPSSQEDTLESLKSIALIEQKVMVPMRDGVRLATDIYRPKTDKPVPVILSKTPYNFNSWGDGKLNKQGFQQAYQTVKRGYAYAVQNERGRYFSEYLGQSQPSVPSRKFLAKVLCLDGTLPGGSQAPPSALRFAPLTP